MQMENHKDGGILQVSSAIALLFAQHVFSMID
jgi:hypothetical protein